MPAAKRKSYGRSKTFSQPGQLPLFVPETTWKPLSPSDWPDLRDSKILGMDVEAHDPNLQEKGPGYIRGDAFVCGIGMANEDGEGIYLPIAHVEDNYDRDQVIRYVQDHAKVENRKCGANFIYDLEALDSLGIEVKGQICDIQTAEPLLDEDRKDGYSLEILAQEYLGEGKLEAGLREAAAIYGVEPKKGMQWIPGRFVAEYGEADAYKPIEIFMQQENRLYEEGLEYVFNMESKLLPILWKMRKRGVRVDLDYFDKLSKEYAIRQERLNRQMDQMLGRSINFNSPTEIARELERLDYKNLKIVSGKLSIDNEWLLAEEKKGDGLCKVIRDLRVVAKMKKDFVDNILECNVNGRVHPQWHALRGDDDGEEGKKKARGTRGGRMSSTKINLQQIPARDKVYGPEIRKGFLAEEGEKFIKNDWASQEPRWMVELSYKLKHCGDPRYVNMPVIDEFMQMFQEDPQRDYHYMTIDLIKARANMEIERPKAKDLSLGRMYGMQRNKMAGRLGVSTKKADEILRAYDSGVPFLSILIEAVIERVKEKGFIRTASGRKRRFNRWEASDYKMKQRYGFEYTVATEAEARELWGSSYQRAFLHKVLNAAIQGSAGDQCKECIIELDSRGILPLMAVHDELNGSESDDNDYVKKNMKEVMESQMKTTVPFYAEQFVYDTWGGNR